MTERPGSTRVGLVVSLAATVTAIAALAVAVWQGAETRKHNRLSVTPLLRVDYNPIRAKRSTVGVHLFNGGAGPAIIRSCAFRIAGEKVILDHAGYAAAVTALALGDLPIKWWVIHPGECLRAGEELFLFGFEADSAAPNDVRKFGQALRDVYVLIDYESIYGEQFTLTWHYTY